ncbi:MAG: BlaI/MecI/CopY family transcriptional regulator [Gemmatimonadota bacterium]
MSADVPLPTPAELEVLKILWDRGPSTVREVHEVRLRTDRIRYTSVLRLLQNMHDKGLVRRDDSSRSHVFESVPGREEMETLLVDHFVQTAFGGSAGRLALRALSNRQATEAELAEIRRLADELDESREV